MFNVIFDDLPMLGMRKMRRKKSRRMFVGTIILLPHGFTIFFFFVFCMNCTITLQLIGCLFVYQRCVRIKIIIIIIDEGHDGADADLRYRVGVLDHQLIVQRYRPIAQQTLHRTSDEQLAEDSKQKKIWLPWRQQRTAWFFRYIMTRNFPLLKPYHQTQCSQNFRGIDLFFIIN